MQLLRVDHLAVWQWPGSGPPILFTHATGFHARVWDPIVEHFPDRSCYGIDLRGHGRSDKNLDSYAWRRFGEDTATVVRKLNLRGVTGVGHSLGGHAMALAAALEPSAFSRLLLVDPVIQSSDRYDSAPVDVEFIAKRRAYWNSAEEMFDRFSTRPPFSGWNTNILRDYCEFGLLPEGGHFVLACPPEIEAAIYPLWNRAEADISAELATIQTPTTIMRSGKLMAQGKFDLSASATDPKLASRMPNARDIYLEGCSHFIPMEHPELVINALKTP